MYCHSQAQLRETEPGKKPQRTITNTQANDREHGLDAKYNTVSIPRHPGPGRPLISGTCTAYRAAVFSLAAGSQRGLCCWISSGALPHRHRLGVAQFVNSAPQQDFSSPSLSSVSRTKTVLKPLLLEACGSYGTHMRHAHHGPNSAFSHFHTS